MQVALATTFTASRKEPLAALLERIRAAFLTAGQGEPTIRFSFSDAPIAGTVSSVDRVLKRYPQLNALVGTASLPGGFSVRQISNDAASRGGAASEPVPFETLLAIAAGVPRSFPFNGISLHLCSAAFGESTAGTLPTGVMIGDSWWINGRMRNLSALTLVEADPASKKLPPLPEPVVAILVACGKMKKTVQAPFPSVASAAPAAPQPVAPQTTAPQTDTPDPVAPNPVAPNPDAARAVRAVLEDYRARFDEILDRAALPHDLPPSREALQNTPLGQSTGPKKPVLVRAFEPLGYDCQAASGTFTLRRRTPGNLTVEISLDVGTWSRSLTAFFKVQGLGFRAVLPLPASRHAERGGQYPIGDADRWQQLVDNLAALVTELDRSFVPAIEAASGPAPEWYRPES